MTYAVYFSEDAKADFEQIAWYIAADSPRRAITFIDELERRMVDTLSVHPLSGPVYKGETRYLSLDRYVVLYEVDDERQIVNVLHIAGGGADWRNR